MKMLSNLLFEADDLESDNLSRLFDVMKDEFQTQFPSWQLNARKKADEFRVNGLKVVVGLGRFDLIIHALEHSITVGCTFSSNKGIGTNETKMVPDGLDFETTVNETFKQLKACLFIVSQLVEDHYKINLKLNETAPFMMVGDKEQSDSGSPNWTKLRTWGNSNTTQVYPSELPNRPQGMNPNTNPEEKEKEPYYHEGVHAVSGPVNTDDTWGDEVVHSEKEYALLPENTLTEDDHKKISKQGEKLHTAALLLDKQLQKKGWKLNGPKPTLDKAKNLSLSLPFTKGEHQVICLFFYKEDGKLKLQISKNTQGTQQDNLPNKSKEESVDSTVKEGIGDNESSQDRLGRSIQEKDAALNDSENVIFDMFNHLDSIKPEDVWEYSGKKKLKPGTLDLQYKTKEGNKQILLSLRYNDKPEFLIIDATCSVGKYVEHQTFKVKGMSLPQESSIKLAGLISNLLRKTEQQSVSEVVDKTVEETFKSKAQQRYFYAQANKGGKKGKEWKKRAKEFSSKTDFDTLPSRAMQGN